MAATRLLGVDDPLRHGLSRNRDNSPCPQPTTITIFGTLVKEPHFVRPLKPQLSPHLTVAQPVFLSARNAAGFSKPGPPQSLHSFFCTQRSLHMASCVTAPLITPLSRTVFSFLASNGPYIFLPYFVIFLDFHTKHNFLYLLSLPPK